MSITDDLLKSMPPILRGIIKALGLKKAQMLLMRFGGTTIVIPKTHSKKLGLSEEDLLALHRELDKHLTNDRITLPKVDKIFIGLRNLEILNARHEKSLSELALEYGLCVRHIQNICRKDDSSQIDLFQSDIFE